jgi:hypothetical protein
VGTGLLRWGRERWRLATNCSGGRRDAASPRAQGRVTLQGGSPCHAEHWLHVKPKVTALAARWGGGHRRENPGCKLMNSIRSYSVRSLRSKGELSLKIFPGSLRQRHCRRAAWGESNRSGPIRARDSEVRMGLYVMVGDGMDGKVTDMQAWGDLRENQSRSGRGPEGSGSAVFRRSRSPHRSDDAGKAKPGGAKGGRKVDALNPDHGKKTKQ